MARDTRPQPAKPDQRGIRALIESRQAAQDTGPWSLGSDLDKYRAHAVEEGSRDSFQSVGFALRSTGMAIEDTWNIVTLGYGSERAKVFRDNDGKGPLEQAGTVLERSGAAVGNAGASLYSLADLIVLNALPDSDSDVYKDNHALVRPFLFIGRAIGSIWKATEAIGNTLTWGLFDNVSGSTGMLVEDVVEVAKHSGEAVTNLARGPGYLIAGRNDTSDALMDWVLLVPLEFASNAVQMKGISNMEDYETAFAQKGVIGSILELGGSAYVAYEVIDEIADELDEDDNHRRTDSGTKPPEPPDGGGTKPPPSGFYLGTDGNWYFVP